MLYLYQDDHDENRYIKILIRSIFFLYFINNFQSKIVYFEIECMRLVKNSSLTCYRNRSFVQFRFLADNFNSNNILHA